MADFTLKDGTLLRGGTYRIVRFISAGGFGCTYEAVHTGLKRRVAIKEFFVKDYCNRDPQNSHVSVGTQSKKELVEKLKGKFLDEASAVANLNHPGIVRVTDVFEENGTAYFVMDYVEGESLAEIIKRRGSLPEDEALRYIREVAEALAYVHGTKRLHLDIKPANIMVDGNGKTTLIDFGVSKQYDEANGENTSTLLGRTAGYAPIEQMSSKLRAFTPATDIYALAATLYKAVTGVTPPDAAELHIGEELAFPDHLSATTIRAIESAMRQKAADRPQSVADFLAILNADADATKVLADKPETAQKKEGEAVEAVAAKPQNAVVENPKEEAAAINAASDDEHGGPSKSRGKKMTIIALISIIAIAASVMLLLPKDQSAPENPLLAVGSDTIPEEAYTGLGAGDIFGVDGLKYRVTSEGKVEVSGNSNVSGDLRIPAKVTYQSVSYDVTSIGENAFMDCSSLTSVNIPNSVTSIGESAFVECYSLTSVNIPNSVTSIGAYAFSGCSGLTSVNIPNSVTSIGDYAFFGCSGLTSVNIPNSVTSIGEGAFWVCSGLTSVNIPNSVTSIGEKAFYGCISLTSVNIPNSVTSIGERAFDGCSGLTSVNIPNGVTSIGEWAFNGCSGLTSVNIPNSVTSIGKWAFNRCENLKSVRIENPNCNIAEYAFRYTPVEGKTRASEFR